MRKWLLYSVACVTVGIACWVRSDDPVPVSSPDVVTTDIAEQTSEDIQIIRVADVHSVVEELDSADDVSVQYTHYLCIDNMLYEVDYVGSSYNYKSGTGHVSSIHPDKTVDCYYDEDSYLLSVDDEEFASSRDFLDTRNKEAGYLSSNLSTIGMIVDVIQHSDKTRVHCVPNGTLYVLTTHDPVYNGELLHPVVDTGVDYVHWQILVSNNDEPHKAKLTIKSCKNDQGIEYEQFSYEFKTNTGFVASFPDFSYKRGNEYEDIGVDEGAAG